MSSAAIPLRRNKTTALNVSTGRTPRGKDPGCRFRLPLTDGLPYSFAPGTLMEWEMALFALGKLVATPGALRFMEQHSINAFELVARHAGGDWGDLGQEDVATNVAAVQHGLRVFSSYKMSDSKLWVITEWDRSYTTILLPEEY